MEYLSCPHYVRWPWRHSNINTASDVYVVYYVLSQSITLMSELNYTLKKITALYIRQSENTCWCIISKKNNLLTYSVVYCTLTVKFCQLAWQHIWGDVTDYSSSFICSTFHNVSRNELLICLSVCKSCCRSFCDCWFDLLIYLHTDAVMRCAQLWHFGRWWKRHVRSSFCFSFENNDYFIELGTFWYLLALWNFCTWILACAFSS